MGTRSADDPALGELMKRVILQITILTAFAAFPGGTASAGWGDYKHDYLEPEEREDRFQLYGHFTGVWDVEENAKGDSSGTEWRNSFGDRSRGALWIAGSSSPGIGYLAEGLFNLSDESFSALQVRGDYSLFPRALTLRFGRFYFPFGIEMRSAPARVNRFVSRPKSRTRISIGAGIYGDILKENINYFLAVADHYAGALADSLEGESVYEDDGEADDGKAWGGRLAFSPRLGLELGFSYAWERHGADPRREATVIGGDFSLSDGPLHLQAEGSRLRRDGLEGEAISTLFYGRLAYRLIEDSERFEAIDIHAGAEVEDPGGDSAHGRLTAYSGGFAIAPGRGLSLRTEYLARREQRAERRNDSFLTEILLFW